MHKALSASMIWMKSRAFSTGDLVNPLGSTGSSGLTNALVESPTALTKNDEMLQIKIREKANSLEKEEQGKIKQETEEDLLISSLLDNGANTSVLESCMEQFFSFEELLNQQSNGVMPLDFPLIDQQQQQPQQQQQHLPNSNIGCSASINLHVSDSTAKNASKQIRRRRLASELLASDSESDASTLIPGLSHSRKQKLLVPETNKDDKYFERRRKNNEAAKKSRDAKKRKEEETNVIAYSLQSENEMLRERVVLLQREIQQLKDALLLQTDTSMTA